MTGAQRAKWIAAILCFLAALYELNAPGPVGWAGVYVVTGIISASAAVARIPPRPAWVWSALCVALLVVQLGSSGPAVGQLAYVASALWCAWLGYDAPTQPEP